MAVLHEYLMSGMRLSIPLVFAAYGGLLSERAGVANIALESYLLASSFGAAALTALSGNPWIGGIGGLTAAFLVASLFAWACVNAKAEQIVTGTAINLVVMGLLPVFGRALFGVSGSTPSLGAELRFQSWEVFFILAFLTLVFVEVLMKKTVFGLRIWAAGENPQSLITQGVSVKRVRWEAICLGSAIAGLGGIYMSMVQGSGYLRNMSAGRGYIALAALIFGRWKPIPTFLACLFFGFADAGQMLLQGVQWNGQAIPNQFIQILPYLLTLVLLSGIGGKVKAPSAINQNY